MMTKDEIREFVKGEIKRYVMTSDMGWDEATERIVAKWEEDVQESREEARGDGWTQGQQQMYEAGARFE